MNIANVDTPGYKKKEVTFEETFRRRLQAASQNGGTQDIRRAIEGTDSLTWKTDSSARVDENNVNLDVEQTVLARTTLQYQYLLQSVSADVTRLRTAIRSQ